MNIFGWSLPAGCGTLPGEEPEDPICMTCADENEELFEQCKEDPEHCEYYQLESHLACCIVHKVIFSNPKGYCLGCMMRDESRYDKEQEAYNEMMRTSDLSYMAAQDRKCKWRD